MVPDDLALGEAALVKPPEDKAALSRFSDWLKSVELPCACFTVR